MTDMELKQKYYDAESVRKAINALEEKERNNTITDDEAVRLDELYKFRLTHYKDNKLAWYSILEMYTVFDYKIVE